MYPGSFAGRLRRYVKCKLAAKFSVSH